MTPKELHDELVRLDKNAAGAPWAWNFKQNTDPTGEAYVHLARITAPVEGDTLIDMCEASGEWSSEDFSLIIKLRNNLPLILRALSALSACEGAMVDRDARQKTVADWCAAAFGEGQASSVEQRGLRLAEEAIEAAQAAGCDPATVHAMVDYIFARAPGTVAQELGGVGVTALALANAAALSADKCEADEVARVLSKPIEHFTARNQAKNDAGFIARSALAQLQKVMG